MNKEDLYYQTHVFCCNNERPADHPRGSCRQRGADDLRNYLKSRVKESGLPAARVNASGCLDRCELGPVFVIYPEGIWYTASTRADIDEIIERQLLKGEKVERLVLTKDQKQLRDGQRTAVC